MNTQLNHEIADLEALVEAQVRGEFIQSARIDAEAPQEAELDLRVSKFAQSGPPLQGDGTDMVSDRPISSEVVLAHE